MPLYHHHHHHHHRPEPYVKDRMNTYFYVYAIFWCYPFGYMSQKTDSEMIFQSSIIQLLRFMANYSLSFYFFISVRNDIPCFRLLRQPICIKDSFFCILVVKSNYLCYCCLSINLDWSDQFFYKLFHEKRISAYRITTHGNIFYFLTILCNPRDS